MVVSPTSFVLTSSRLSQPFKISSLVGGYFWDIPNDDVLLWDGGKAQPTENRGSRFSIWSVFILSRLQTAGLLQSQVLSQEDKFVVLEVPTIFQLFQTNVKKTCFLVFFFLHSTPCRTKTQGVSSFKIDGLQRPASCNPSRSTSCKGRLTKIQSLILQVIWTKCLGMFASFVFF